MVENPHPTRGPDTWGQRRSDLTQAIIDKVSEVEVGESCMFKLDVEMRVRYVVNRFLNHRKGVYHIHLQLDGDDGTVFVFRTK